MRIEGKDKYEISKPHDKKDCSTAMAVTSDEELALRAQKGSDESFAELVRRYGRSILIFMQRSTGNLHDAEDLVQDTFVKVYKNIRRYRSSYGFSTWLYTIARRLAASYYRGQKKIKNTGRDSGSQTDPYNVAAEKESREELWALAGSLSENQYQALWLKYVENMSIKEISRVMGKSQVNVKVLLYRARMNLAGRLKNSALYDESEKVVSSRQNPPF